MKPNKLMMAMSLALLSNHALSANINGKVTDASKTNLFENAKVTLLETGQVTSSDGKGRFVFTDLSAGTYTIQVEYIGAEKITQQVQVGEDHAQVELVIGEDTARMDNMLVVGQAAGLSMSMNKQKNAENLVNVLSADAVGQLPDQNVTEALQRVPGISITRDQGEGRFITVRGMDPNFNAISINGVSLPSAEATDRQVALDVIPSDLIEEVTVSKTVRADKDGDSLGGNIDVKSLSAFDRGGQTFNLRLESSYNDLVDEFSPKLSGTYTNLFSLGDGYDNFGIAASVSWFDRSFGSDNLETDGGWEAFETPQGDLVLPPESEQRDYTVNRERLGVAFNIDYQPTDYSSFYFRTLFSDFEDNETRLRNEIKWDKGDVVSVNGGQIEFSDVEVQKELKARLETQTIQSYVFGGEHWVNDWEIDYALGYSKSEEEEPNRIDATFENDFNMGLNINSRIPGINASEASLLAGNYELDAVEFADNITEDEETSFALNFKRRVQIADDQDAYFKFGFKQRNRDKYNDQNIVIFDDFGQDYTLADFPGGPVSHFSQPFGAVVNRRSFSDFFFSGINGFGFDAEDSAIESLGADYDVSEDITAAYMMARYQTGNSKWIGGLRIERTEFTANGVRVTIDDQVNDGDATFSDLKVKKNYANLLPSLNFIHEFNDRLILRAAASESLVRPNFGDSAPLEILEIEEDDGEIERKAEVGNPLLKPLTAQNYDLSLEFYPGDIAVISAGIFYKDIKNFIVRADVAGSDEYADFDEAIKPLNGSDADLFGLELNYAQQLKFLQAPWDGLIVSANYTHTDSSANLDFRTQDISLPRQSDNVANVALGYEKNGFSLRAAWTYRDQYFAEITELDDPSLDLYVDEHLQFDISAKYLVNDRFQIYAEGINLNNEPFYAFFGDRSQLAQYEKYGWTAQIGFKVFFE
jgi:TonB-dependent receptor